jgi:CDP-diacylglycerol--serine O-phosphatidyltransferase
MSHTPDPQQESSLASFPSAPVRPRKAAQAPAIGLQRIIPNMITLMALIAGVTSVQMAINQNFETAVLMLLVAAIFDVLDGAVARALKASSEFGAELDSLSDFLAFGVAPATLLYIWALDDAGRFGWIATVILPMAAALRLARFNVMAKKSAELPLWKKRYFSGVPTPAGAGLALLPVYIWFLSPETFEIFSFATPLIGIWTIIVAALMVSRIPTFSFKYMKLPARGAVPVMALIGLVIAALIHAPWVTLTLISLAYVASIPVVLHRYRKQEKEFSEGQEDLSSLAFGMDSLPEDESPNEEEEPGDLPRTSF